MIRREADIVLAGGSEAAICPIGIAGFNSARALSTIMTILKKLQDLLMQKEMGLF